MKDIFIDKPGSGKMDFNPEDFYAENRRSFNIYFHHLRLRKKDFLNGVKKRGEVIALDLMCGVGNAVFDLNNIEGVVAYGVDRNSYQTWSEHPERFIQADVEDLSFIKDKSVDYVFNIIGFRDWCSNWQKAFSESLRVLSPKGKAFYYPYYPEYLSGLSLIDRLVRYKVNIGKGKKYCGITVDRSLVLTRSQNDK